MCDDKDEFRVGTTGKNIVFFKENFLFSARLMEGGYIVEEGTPDEVINHPKQPRTIDFLSKVL